MNACIHVVIYVLEVRGEERTNTYLTEEELLAIDLPGAAGGLLDPLAFRVLPLGGGGVDAIFWKVLLFGECILYWIELE